MKTLKPLQKSFAWIVFFLLLQGIAVQSANAVCSITANYCLANGQVALTAHPSFLNYHWSNGATTQTIIVNQAGNYNVSVADSSGQCEATINVGGELVVNGNFTAGNTGFSSSYGYSSNLVPEGLYYVTTNAHFTHSGFFGTDHTSGTGNFMVVNGSGTPNTLVWSENISVVPNTMYYFSTWVTNVDGGSPALLQFSINNIQLGAVFAVPAPNFLWTRFFTSWFSGANTTAGIKIINQNTVLGGNDFGMDDISFSTLSPVGITPTIAVTHPICSNNGSADLTVVGGASPYTYAWSNGASTEDISGLGAGIYTVTVTDANGCTASASAVLVLTGGVLTPAAEFTPIACNGGSSTVTVTCGGGTPPYSGTGTSTLAAGTYSFTVTDANGCSASTSITITQPDPVSANVESTRILCTDGTSTVTVNGSGGTPPYSGTGTSHLAAGTYTFTVTDANGCSATTSLTIAAPGSFTVDAGPDEQTYYGYSGDQSVTHTAVVTGGVGPYTYSWSMNRVLKCNQINLAGDETFNGGTCTNNACPSVCPALPTSCSPPNVPVCSGNPSITVMLMDSAIICVTVTDANGCTAVDCFTLRAEDARCFAGSSNNAKVKVCHRTGSSSNTWVQICIAQDAVAAHLINNPGDYVGTCGAHARLAAPGTQTGETEFSGNLQSYPNPFSNHCTMKFLLPESGAATLKVYNSFGQEVKTLFNGKAEGEQVYTVEFDATELSSGLYFCSLVAEGVNEVQQVQVIK